MDWLEYDLYLKECDIGLRVSVDEEGNKLFAKAKSLDKIAKSVRPWIDTDEATRSDNTFKAFARQIIAKKNKQ